MALKINDNPKFLAKIAKLTAWKDSWYAVLKAVNCFENFKDSEDQTPQLVQKQFEHAVIKCDMYMRIRDEKKEEKEAAAVEEQKEEKEEKEAAAVEEQK